MFEAARPIISTTCTVVCSLAFLYGAQSRLTSLITPEFHEEQHKKTAESQKELYTFLNITPEQCTRLIGYFNLVAVAGLLWPPSRKISAGLTALYMGLGVLGRFRTGRSVKLHWSLWLSYSVRCCREADNGRSHQIKTRVLAGSE